MKRVIIFIISLLIVGAILFWLFYGVLKIELSEAITTSALITTVIAIAVQSWATKEIVENDTRPAVEVSMLCSKEYGTCFQFLRLKTIPALVYVTVNVKVELNGKWKKVDINLLPKLVGKEPWRVIHQRYRTMYYEFMKPIVEKYPDKEIEATLKISLAPIFDTNKKLPFYTKYYKLNRKTYEWWDTCWNRSDPDFF